MRRKIFAVIGIALVIGLMPKSIYATEKISIGIVTVSKYKSEGKDDLDDRPSAGPLGYEFSAEITSGKYDNIASRLFHYENKHAWKQDLQAGDHINSLGKYYPTIDDVDFAIYCGHGLKKDDKIAHNALHFYTKNSNTNFTGADKYNKEANLMTTEAKWGSGNAKTKWVALYTCNFLNQDDGCYKIMLEGVHQVLGFSTKMYIVSDCGYWFAKYLTAGYDIDSSFIMSAYKEILPRMDEKCVVTILSAKQSASDTIYKYSSKPSPIGRGGTYIETNTLLGNQYK